MTDRANHSNKSASAMEAERRARILQRYMEIGMPSTADDERFASELGLSRETLYKLVRSWRRHTNPSFLSGARTATTSDDRQAALLATSRPNLSGVNPARRPEIRRRIDVLRSYLAIDYPALEDEAKAASALGLKLGAFRRLHRTWLLTRDPASLPGASTPAKVPRRRNPALSPLVERHIADAIMQLGPDTNSLAVHREVKKRCVADGLRVPDKSTVYYRLVQLRALSIGNDVATTIAVDHVAIALPVDTGGNVQFPILSVALTNPGGRILAFELSMYPPSAKRTAGLLSRVVDICAADRAAIVPLEIGLPKGADWDQLLDVLVVNGVEVADTPTRSLRAGRLLSRRCGESFGRIKLRPGITMRADRAPRTPLRGKSESLSFAEARTIVAEMVDAFNRERPIGPVCLLPLKPASQLKKALCAIQG